MARKPASKTKTTKKPTAKKPAAKKAATPKRKRMTLKQSHAELSACHRKLALVLVEMMPTMASGPKEARRRLCRPGHGAFGVGHGRQRSDTGARAGSDAVAGARAGSGTSSGSRAVT